MKKKLTLLFALLCVSVMSWGTNYCNTALTNENSGEYAGDGATDGLYFTASKTGTLETTFQLTSTKKTLTGLFNGQAILQNNGGGTVVGDFATGWEVVGNNLQKVVTWTTYPTSNLQIYLVANCDGAPPITGAQIRNIDVSAACLSCTDETKPSISAVDVSDVTSNSAVLTITASDPVEEGSGIASYVVKNNGSQIASSSSNVITLTGLTASTLYDDLTVNVVDNCGNTSDAFDVESFTTLNRPSECSGDLGHWAVPATKRISYTIEYFPVIDKIKYTVHGYNTEVLNYLEIRTTEGVSGSLGITDGVAIWFQNAPAAGTEMAIQFYYGLESLGAGREITADGAVSLSNPQCTYYKSHDCENSTYPATVPAAPDDKNDCQVFSIFGTEGFATNATHAEAWDGAKSFLTGKVNGKEVYYTTAGTTANIQYPSKNINEYDKLHFDIWTDAAREIGVELCINAGTHGTKQNITTTAGAWKSVELDITGFHDPKDVNTTFLFFSSLARETYYLANVYLYKTADDESCYESLNIALKKPVVAGYTPSDPNEVPSKANDGNEGSEWTTWQNRPASEEWWYVDLMHVYNLTNISIMWGGDYSTNYILQTRIEEPAVADRANDEAWTTVATVTDATASAVKSNNITAAGRYVRIHSLARSNADLLRMKEFRVFGSGFADVDTEKPVMTSATLDSKTNNRVVINVAATDNKGIASYHVVETTHSINESLSAEEGKITITGLTAATEYSFVITAVDFFDNESDNNKTVTVTTNAYYTEPQAACAVPTLDASLVKAIYSPTYSADYNHQDWGGGTVYTQEEYGKKYVTNPAPQGYFGADGFSLNCLLMEKLHYDIWIADDATIRIVPIWGGAEQGITVNLAGQQWNSIDINLSEYTGITNWGNIYQMKIDQAYDLTFWIANAYFYREAPYVDTEAPTNASASKVAEGFYSVQISAQAEDNSGAVSFKVMNGEEVLANGAAASGVATTITVNNLTPGTNYNFNVVAYDEANNEAEPVVIAAETKSIPAAAPTPDFSDKKVVAVFTDAMACEVSGIQSGGWGETTQVEWLDIAEGNKVFYGQKFNFAGWHSWGGGNIDATGMQYLHVDIYSAGMTAVNVTPISSGREGSATITLTPNAWTSYDVPLSAYDANSIDWANIFQFKFMGPVGGNELMIDNVYFWKEPDITRDDSWMAPGELGTICIPQGAVATGGDIYELLGKDENGKIVFATVANNEMEPGKPYLFEAKSDAMRFFSTSEPLASEPDNSGAMKGTFNEVTLTGDQLNNVYYFAGHSLWSCVDLTSTGLHVSANRAWVVIDEDMPSVNTSSPMPGRRIMTMNVNSKTTPTAIDQVNSSEAVRKVILDGTLYILRGEKLYDATGRLVK